MALDECPHCIRKVIFFENGICPACGESRFHLPSKSREQIIYDKEKNDTIEGIKFYTRRGSGLIIGGLIFTIVVICIIVFMAIHSKIMVFWYGGIFIGVSSIGKGLIDFQQRRELIYFFENKYNEKLPNR